MKHLKNIPRNRKPTKQEYLAIIDHARIDAKYGMLLYLLCRCLQTKKPMWRTWMNLLNQTIDRINSLEEIETPPEGELNLIDIFLTKYDKTTAKNTVT
ncbi:hypothetical protein F8C76_10200 [Flagellimonas olearia]|uniref:Uncharacterized protein n=1 Tax=Flagellimonas olearia TaxID=552546 RepID=A0A6I1DY28_9FLAO|nr:hypothetical protein [Allomuricauda olearia]KAB7528233.1 hypothetical protein F8C76_10200 [Allomuricauda olearia]